MQAARHEGATQLRDSAGAGHTSDRMSVNALTRFATAFLPMG
jgi:hypothetical protein